MSHFLFSSESVSRGHPDKVADQISDAVLDALLLQDQNSRVACETLVTKNLIVVAGEIATSGKIDVPAVVCNTISDIGYNDPKYDFSPTSCELVIRLHQQSPDIANGIETNSGFFESLGAGDQGIMFGYASDETPEFMPMPIALAHKLTQKLLELRTSKQMPFLGPDAKTQVSVEYLNNVPQRIDTIVLSTQHSPDIEYHFLKQKMIEVIRKVIPAHLLDSHSKFLINPTGRFVLGGPAADCGLTGRKIVVDTYGGFARTGGGGFSGKDPSKVDRSAAYMARYIAKNIVAAEIAQRCEIQLAYAIGVPDPVSIKIETFGTGKVDDEHLAMHIPKIFDLTPQGIINYLHLNRPIYSETAYGGHFGRELPHFTWEKVDKITELQTCVFK